MKHYRRKLINKFICVLLTMSFIICSLGTSINIFAEENNAKLTIKGTENYNRAFDVMDSINDYRKDEGLSLLKMDENILNGAMVRAAESTIFLDMTRPDGSDFFDAKEFDSIPNQYKDCSKVMMISEGGDYNADYLVYNWMLQSSYFKKMALDDTINSIGVGSFQHNRRTYYVVIFSKMTAKQATNKGLVEVSKDIETSKDNIKLQISKSSSTLNSGETLDLSIKQVNKYCDSDYAAEYVAAVENSSFVWKSSNEKVTKVSSSGTVTAIGPGSCTIIASLSNNVSISCNVTVAGNGVKKINNLKQTSNSTSTITLSWDKISGVSGYEVYKYNEKANKYDWLATNSSSSKNTYKNEKLTSATVYKYKVRAYKLKDGKKVYGEYSQELSATTDPNKVKNLHAKEITSSTVSLDWDSVSRASAYSIYRSNSKNGEYKYVKTVSTSSAKDYNLASNKTYYYKVRAFKTLDNKKYYGSYSDIFTTRTKPSQVKNLRLSSNSSSQITIEWDKISGVSGYAVYKYNNSTESYSRVKTITSYSTTSYKNEKLSTGTTYKYKVRAYKTVNGSNLYGDYSDELVTTTDPAKVTNLKTNGIGTSYVNLTWNKASGAYRYAIYRSTNKSSGYSKIATSSSNNFKDDTVKSKTKYYYKVRAYKYLNGRSYYGGESNVLTATTKTAQVTGLQLEKYSSTYLDLKWKSINNCDGYQIYRSTSKYGSYSLVKTLYKTSGSDYVEKNGYVTYRNLGLSSAKTYYYKVRGFNKLGSSSKVYLNFSDVLTTATSPYKVKNLMDENYRTKSSLKIKWDKVSGASGYEIYRKTKSDSKTITVNNKTTSYTDTKLESGYSYTYQVRAYKTFVDSNGKTCKSYGLYSDELELRTVGPESTLSIQDSNYPGNMEIGNKFNLKGTIYSNYNIRNVEINIVDLSNNEIKCRKTINLKEDIKKYSISEIAKDIKFETLSEGKYKYVLYAEDDYTDNALKLIDKDFEINLPPIVHPLTSPSLTSGFTYCRSGFPFAHFASDYISLDGNYDIRAFADGTVDTVNPYDTNPSQDGRGKFIIIKHKIKTNNGEKTVYSRYYHLAEIDSSIQVGATVKSGQKIAVMGNTGMGYGSDTWTNRHLHFAISTTNSAAEKTADPSKNVENDNSVTVVPDAYYNPNNGAVTFYNPKRVFEVGVSIFE